MGKRRRIPGVPGYLPADSLLGQPVARTLDLHGKTAEQARERVRDFVLTTSRGASGRVVRFITGKGTGSAGQAVLRPHSAWPRPTPGSSDAWASWIRAGNAG